LDEDIRLYTRDRATWAYCVTHFTHYMELSVFIVQRWTPPTQF